MLFRLASTLCKNSDKFLYVLGASFNMNKCDTKIQLDMLLAKLLHLLTSFADLIPYVPKRVGCACEEGQSLKSARREPNVENAERNPTISNHTMEGLQTLILLLQQSCYKAV